MAEFRAMLDVKNADRVLGAGADALKNQYEIQFVGVKNIDPELLTVRALDFKAPERTRSTYNVDWGFFQYKFGGGKITEERILDINFRSDVLRRLQLMFQENFDASLYQAGKPMFGFNFGAFDIHVLYLDVPEGGKVLGEKFLHCQTIKDPGYELTESEGDPIQLAGQFTYTRRKLILPD